MRSTAWISAIAFVALAGVASAQKPDADVAKLVDQYQAAFNKGDAKALAAMYTTDATRLGTDGQMVVGKAAIEKSYTEAFAGPLKGSKLTLTDSTARVVTPDVKVIDGRFSTTGGTPSKGRYVNTIVHRGTEWLLASVVTVPDAPAAAKK